MKKDKIKLTNRQKYAIRQSVFALIDSKSVVENYDEYFEDEDMLDARVAIEDYISVMYEWVLQKEGIQDE